MPNRPIKSRQVPKHIKKEGVNISDIGIIRES
jgi:hypothetical protein